MKSNVYNINEPSKRILAGHFVVQGLGAANKVNPIAYCSNGNGYCKQKRGSEINHPRCGDIMKSPET